MEQERYWRTVNSKVNYCKLTHEIVSIDYCKKCKDGLCKYKSKPKHDDWIIEDVKSTRDLKKE